MTFYDNQNIIFSENFQVYNVDFFGLKLLDSITDLDQSLIKEIYCVDNSRNFCKEGKLELLKTNNGWIHLTNGTSFQTNNGTIDKIKLTGDSITKLSKITKSELVKLIGRPDRMEIETSSFLFDVVIEADIFIYEQKQLQVFFDQDSKWIKEIWLEHLQK